MASWIKLLTTLPKDRDVYLLMRELRCKRHAALGLAVDWLCWLDANSTNGETGLMDEEISDVLGWPHAAEALNAIGWISHDDRGCVLAVGFDKHNGESAKRRAEDALRQRRSRAGRDRCHENNVTKFGLDKIREDKNRDGELSATVVSGERAPSAPPPVVPCSPQPDGLRGEEVAPFGAWLRRLQGVVPLLARLNVDRPLPRSVMEAAVAAWRLVPLPDGELEALRLFYAAESVRGYRPDSLEHFFRDLPDVLQHASRFAAAEARRVRKAQAAERARARAVPVVAPDRAPDEVDEQMRYWRSLDGVADEQRD